MIYEHVYGRMFFLVVFAVGKLVNSRNPQDPKDREY